MAISTDGSVRYRGLQASIFVGTFPTLQSAIAGVGNASFVDSTDPNNPLNATVIQGPLAGMTTTYNAFCVAWGSEAASAANPVPALSEWALILFVLLTAANGAYIFRRR